MSPKTSFWFYLASVVCFVVAAAGADWRYGRLGRRGRAPPHVQVPQGLALIVLPTQWNTGKLAF